TGLRFDEDEPWWTRRLILSGVTRQDSALPDLYVALRPSTGGGGGNAPAEPVEAQTVQIVGVIAESTTLAGEGILVPAQTFAAVSAEPVVPDNFYIKAAEGADVHEVARAVEREFLNN